MHSRTVLDSIMELVEALQAVPSLVDKVDIMEESQDEDREVALTVALKDIAAVLLDFLVAVVPAKLHSAV